MSMASPGTRPILSADRLESTIGTLLLIHDRDGHVRALDFHDFESRMRRLLRLHYGAEENDFAVEDRAAPTTIRRAISDYFSDDLCAVNSIPVTTGGTSFQREVWAALRTIEAGTTLSYGALARQLGRPKSVRAVGSANGANPVAIVVPCHRVIGADGSLTGYGGGISRKRWLLTHEGIALEQFAKQRIPEAAGIPEAELMQSRPEGLYRPLPPQKDGEMNQVEKAARFSELHVKGAPLLLYN